MGNNINFFPTLSESNLESLNLSIKYSFFYKPNGFEELEEIKHEIVSNKNISLDITSDNCHWDSINYDLRMIVTVEYENGDKLYGAEGVCPSGGELSIGLEWFSSKSKKRGFVTPNKCVIEKQSDRSKKVYEVLFEKNVFEHDININIILYMSKKANTVLSEENFLNNHEGVILGVLDDKILYMSGTGSIFPIFIKPMENGKLWDLEIECNDPATDKFNDCIKLILNSNHKDYCLLDVTNKNYCDRVIFEIIASVITTLICHLKEEGKIEDIEGDCDDGSILQFLKYYKNVLGLKLDDVVSISSSIREYLDRGN